MWTPALFYIAVFASLWLLYKNLVPAGFWLLPILAWLGLQGILAHQGFYTYAIDHPNAPPRFVLPVLPAILWVIISVYRTKNMEFQKTDWIWLTAVHIVRIPVELGLHSLYEAQLIPISMTYDGRNFDIISGLTAPLVMWAIHKNIPSLRFLLLAWNSICLILLLQIVITGVLSAPGPQQIWSFDQPNKGVLMFPYIFLPAFIVPLVLWSHLKALICLFKNGKVNG